jgi:hypothetical protein
MVYHIAADDTQYVQHVARVKKTPKNGGKMGDEMFAF